jgi:phosphoribosylformimino-5-aminoimidazole carboxamide ribotide isomerase
MRIIPAIDIIEGKCVRLSKGDFSTKKIYSENPLEVAKKFEDAGVKFLHLVDLDGARAKKIVNHKVLSEIASQTNLQIDFGGGLRSDEDLKIAFDNGAAQITAGSIAVQDEELVFRWMNKFGAEKIILGADASNGKIATNGWLKSSEIELIPFVEKYLLRGLNYVICTDIEKDGMLKGPSFEVYSELLQLSNIKLIASGGVTSVDDLIKLKEMGCEGAIIGKALYEGYLTIENIAELC